MWVMIEWNKCNLWVKLSSFLLIILLLKLSNSHMQQLPSKRWKIFDKNLIIYTNLKYFSLITDNEFNFPSNSLSSCEAVFNTSEVAFYYLETLKITGCTPFTNLTKSSFPTGYSITHLKLSYGGLEHVEADSLLVSRDRPKGSFSHSAKVRSKLNVHL